MMSNLKQTLDHRSLTRRELLCRCGMGFGAVGLSALGQPWDSHDDLEVNYRRLAKE
jgi:hypothetical protein